MSVRPCKHIQTRELYLLIRTPVLLHCSVATTVFISVNLSLEIKIARRTVINVNKRPPVIGLLCLRPDDQCRFAGRRHGQRVWAGMACEWLCACVRGCIFICVCKRQILIIMSLFVQRCYAMGILLIVNK